MYVVFLIGALACRGGDPASDPGPDPTEDPSAAVTFPTPWEDAGLTASKVDGWLLAELDSELPGAGWFDAPGAKGHDAVFASVRDVQGATYPVVQIWMTGKVASGWHTLEIDVALNHWVAGDVPLDGEAAVGVLTEAEGRVRYLADGVLHVVSPGIAAGDRVELSFDRIGLAEVVP